MPTPVLIVLQDKLHNVYLGTNFYMKCELEKFEYADIIEKLLNFQLLIALLTIFCSRASSCNNVNPSTVVFCVYSTSNHDRTQ